MRSALTARTLRLRFRLLAVLLSISLFGLSVAHADLVTGTWTVASGSPTLTNTTTASPTWGNGTSNNASGSSIYSPFSAITLANIGDKLTLTGTADLLGITSGNSVFRFGVFNVNGSSNVNGWLGYFATNAATGPGTLYERSTTNTSLFTSTTAGDVSALTTGSSSGSTSLTTAANPVSYSFSFTIERGASDTLIFSTSLLRPSDSAQFASYNFTDASPTTYVFNRVGFQGTAGLAADQIQFNNVDVSFTPAAIPEPSTYAAILSALCLVGTILHRRRRAVSTD